MPGFYKKSKFLLENQHLFLVIFLEKLIQKQKAF